MMAGLIHQSDLTYLGAFDVPQGTIGPSTFEYGGTALAYNPAHNSLFMVGHDWDQDVAEVAIPPLRTGSLSNLATAAVLQPFNSVLSRIPNQTLDEGIKIGGLMVNGNRLIGTAYEYYDSDDDAVDSHFTLSSTNLASAQVGGMYQVGNIGGGFVGGYMTHVPAEWQDELGTSYLTGQAGLSIISRTSVGPAPFGFDPTLLGAQPAPAERLLMYTLAHPLAVETTQNPLFNTTTEIRGIVFPEGTDTVLFIGSHGTGPWWYGLPDERGYHDPYRPDKGPHAPEYEYQVWAYNVHDLIAVKNGEKQFWQVRPYDVWDFDLPYPEGGKHIGGVAYDAASGRLYISQQFANGAYPVIHAFQIGAGLSLTNTRTPIAEDISASQQGHALPSATMLPADLRVADIVAKGVSADSLQLSGVDQNYFSISGNGLYLKAGTTLNYEAKSSYAVTIEAGDAATGLFHKDFMLQIANENDSPVLDKNVPASLGTITEDLPVVSNRGSTVSSFIAGISDEDAAAKRGIAVISLTERYSGVWQFSTNGGTSWLPLGSPSDSAARLLGPSDLVRFLPKANYHGTPQLRFRAWDQSNGLRDGSIAKTTGHQGGGGAYSVAAKSAKLIVAAVNDAPVLTLAGVLGYTRGAAAVILSPIGIVADTDDLDFAGGQLRVSITSGVDASNRLLIAGGFRLSGTQVLENGVQIGTLSSDGVGTSDLVITFNSNAKAATVQRLVRSITFRTIGPSPRVNREFAWQLTDGDGGASQVRTKTVVIY